MIDRRAFLLQAGAVATAAAYAPSSTVQSPSGLAAALTLHEIPGEKPIPLTYTGFSYELAQLTDPTFFSPGHADLVAHFRLLSPHGVLRIGGNTSESSWIKVDPATPPPTLRIPANPDSNWMPHQLFAIEPAAIDALAGFLKVTGWRLIFGLNFGSSSPERAAAEAASVAAKVGDALEFFQIGNEPDFYHDANNGTRPPTWGFADYLTEWTAFAQAIAARVPNARFGGPDVGASSDWVTRFGEQISAAIGPRLVAMTGHYYAEGPPNDPRVTIERLLAGNAKIPAEMERIEAVARARGRIYRMTEGNSCYRGGKPGMSDAFASALWAGDYMLQLATLGCAGVNLHGGSSAFLTAGLGGHTPGMDAARNAKIPQQKMPSGFYTPISTEPGAPVKAMPIFYGMMLANQLAGGISMRVEGLPAGVNAAAYVVRDGAALKIAIFNKDERQGLDLALSLPNHASTAKVWRLHASSLDATDGVTLAGAEIEPHARWEPQAVETLAVRFGVTHMHVPRASAALMTLNAT